MELSRAKELIDYHYWARDRLLDSVAVLDGEQLRRDLGSSFPSVRDTLVHLCLTEWIWHERWSGRSPAAPPRSASEFTDLAQIRELWREHELQIRSFVDALTGADMPRAIEYRLMSGQPGRSSFAEMIAHVVNHGTYHRGQITTMLRQLEAPPAKNTDLITFFRERAAERLQA
jgi:uncharacterized damage-inducible protein DinB